MQGSAEYLANPRCGGMIAPEYVSIIKAREGGVTVCEIVNKKRMH